MVQFPGRHMGTERYMKRANTHSPGTLASGGIGTLLYSQAGYSRNLPGCCAVRAVRLPTVARSLNGAVAHNALKSARQGIANRRPRNFIVEVAAARIAWTTISPINPRATPPDRQSGSRSHFHLLHARPRRPRPGRRASARRVQP